MNGSRWPTSSVCVHGGFASGYALEIADPSKDLGSRRVISIFEGDLGAPARNLDQILQVAPGSRDPDEAVGSAHVIAPPKILISRADVLSGAKLFGDESGQHLERRYG